MLAVVIQSLADNIGNGITAEAHARAAKNAADGDASGPTVLTEFTQHLGLRSLVQVFPWPDDGGTSRTAFKGGYAASCSGTTM